MRAGHGECGRSEGPWVCGTKSKECKDHQHVFGSGLRSWKCPLGTVTRGSLFGALGLEGCKHTLRVVAKWPQTQAPANHPGWPAAPVLRDTRSPPRPPGWGVSSAPCANGQRLAVCVAKGR